MPRVTETIHVYDCFHSVLPLLRCGCCSRCYGSKPREDGLRIDIKVKPETIKTVSVCARACVCLYVWICRYSWTRYQPHWTLFADIGPHVYTGWWTWVMLVMQQGVVHRRESVCPGKSFNASSYLSRANTPHRPNWIIRSIILRPIPLHACLRCLFKRLVRAMQHQCAYVLLRRSSTT